MYRLVLVLCLLCPWSATAADPAPCLECHAGNAGGGLAPLLEGQHREYLEIQLTRFREHIRPSFPMRDLTQGLNDEVISELALELSKRPWRGVRPQSAGEAAARGQALAGQRDCAACHGEGMLGGGSIPRLAGQSVTYLQQQLLAFSAGGRYHPPTGGGQRMQALSTEQAADLARWLGSL